MTTYLIKQDVNITRQEGDNASIVFVVPEALSLTNRTATFKVMSLQGNNVMSKTSGSGLTITGQQISILLTPANTKGFAGTHKWELELSTPEIITIGRGSFIIIPETIT